MRLLSPHFEQLIFALTIPEENILSYMASQEQRVSALLEWVESPIACGLAVLNAVLSDISPLAIDSVLTLQPNSSTRKIAPAPTSPTVPPSSAAFSTVSSSGQTQRRSRLFQLLASLPEPQF